MASKAQIACSLARGMNLGSDRTFASFLAASAPRLATVRCATRRTRSEGWANPLMSSSVEVPGTALPSAAGRYQEGFGVAWIFPLYVSLSKRPATVLFFHPL